LGPLRAAWDPSDYTGKNLLGLVYSSESKTKNCWPLDKCTSDLRSKLNRCELNSKRRCADIKVINGAVRGSVTSGCFQAAPNRISNTDAVRILSASAPCCTKASSWSCASSGNNCSCMVTTPLELNIESLTPFMRESLNRLYLFRKRVKCYVCTIL